MHVMRRIVVGVFLTCAVLPWTLRGVAQTRTNTAATATDVSIALTGDSLITRPLSPHKEPEHVRLFELIRAQDAAFTNLEMSLHDYEMYPMVESGGLHLRGEPSLAKELVWAGFRIVSLANNHAVDWGGAGLRLTRKYAGGRRARGGRRWRQPPCGARGGVP